MTTIEQAFANFQTLSPGERIEVLTMLIQYKHVLHKVLPDAPLIKYLVTGEGSPNDPMIMAYTQWKDSLTNLL
jgi:hypothetical protein